MMKNVANLVLKIVGACLVMAAAVCFIVAYREKVSACCAHTKQKIIGKKFRSEYDDYADMD